MVGVSGAVASRSVYRCLGTLAGAVGLLFVIPAFTAPTELMLLAVAAWVGAFLYVSLLIRGPRSYAFLLAGYTLPLVGMSQANNPSVLFDLTQWRVEEIGLGVAMSVCAHAVFAPRSVKPVLLDQIRATIDGARHWILRGLGPDVASDADRRDRGRLGIDLVEMSNLAVHLSFEAGVTAYDVATVSALEERMLALLPLIASIEERLSPLRAVDASLAARVDAHLMAVRLQLTDAPNLIDAVGLGEATRGLVNAERHDLTSAELLAIGAMERLAELLNTWSECLALFALLHADPPAADRTIRAPVVPRSLHVDRARAANSAVATMLAVTFSGGVCWALGWDQGGAGVGFAAMYSAMFASLDDPRGVLTLVVAAIVLTVPVGAFYVFAVFPALDGALWLAVALTPPFVAAAFLMANPKLGLPAFFFISLFISMVSLQPAQQSDFTNFTNLAMSMALGATVALVVVSQVRVIGAETNVRRLLRATWRELAAMADDTHGLSRVNWSSRMLDRIGLLLPRLAGTSGILRDRAERALDDLRVGANIIELRSADVEVGAEAHAAVGRTIGLLGAHFRKRLTRPDAAPELAILASIDEVITGLLAADASGARVRGLTAATGLRQTLFPSTVKAAKTIEEAAA
jgi:uncharacterized membrane protein YccC